MAVHVAACYRTACAGQEVRDDEKIKQLVNFQNKNALFMADEFQGTQTLQKK